jgi:hypothetical protein
MIANQNARLLLWVPYTLLSVLFTLAVTILTNPALADSNDQNKQNKEELKIKYLLEKVEKSDAVFIRNGDEHSAKKAREHLEHKMNMARKMFWFFGPAKDISALEFIEKIAAKSSTTNKIYKVRLPSGKTLPTEVWLKELLKGFPQKSESP